MLRYFYAYTPFVIVGTVFLLALPWLGLVALVVFALFALAALAAFTWAVVALPYMLMRSLSHRWQERSCAASQPMPALSLVERKSA